MPRRARALVMDLISRGREAGTPEAEAARRSVARFLTELGYIVQEHSFRFNAGVYRSLAAAGAVLAVVALVEIPLLQRTAPAWGALVVLLVQLAVTIVVVTGLMVRGDGGPGPVRVDANLIASRPGSTVRCWLVAHLDTKAQAQSMAGRLVAVWVTVLAVTALLLSALLRTGHPLPAGPAAAAGAAGVLAGVLLSRGRLSGASPGARDNGSGLLAVLTAAELATDPSHRGHRHRGRGVRAGGRARAGPGAARALRRGGGRERGHGGRYGHPLRRDPRAGERRPGGSGARCLGRARPGHQAAARCRWASWWMAFPSRAWPANRSRSGGSTGAR